MDRICLLTCLCSTTSGASDVCWVSGRVVTTFLHTRLLMVQPFRLSAVVQIEYVPGGLNYI